VLEGFRRPRRIGIPADLLERAFDHFYQIGSHLTRRHGGMGLGSSIAKLMVEMHNGRLACEGNVGTGRLSSFMLPVDGPAARHGRREVQLRSGDARGHRWGHQATGFTLAPPAIGLVLLHRRASVGD
jgi:hypothetical protein